MSIDLYYHTGSPPSRAVLMCAEALGVKLNLIVVNMMTGDNMKPEFVKMNPQHNIPVINDNGFYLNESRAIMMYLANAYGKTDKFYPKPAKQRALVDQRLSFDATSLFASFADVYFPAMFAGQPLRTENLRRLDEMLGILDGFLDKTKYAAGDSLTIADFSIMASLSTFESVGIKLNTFPKVMSYYNKCKGEIKNYDELNGKGALVFGQIALALINKSN